MVEGSPVQILDWRYAEISDKGVTECSLRHTCGSGKLFDGQALAVMLFDEIHGHPNDLFSRNRVAARRDLHRLWYSEQIADLSKQFLLRRLLARG